MSGIWERARKRREHRWSWRHIHDYVDGDLSPEQEGRLERHAFGCEECGPLVRSLLALVGGLRRTRPRAPASVVPGVLERLRAEPSAGPGIHAV